MGIILANFFFIFMYKITEKNEKYKNDLKNINLKKGEINKYYMEKRLRNKFDLEKKIKKINDKYNKKMGNILNGEKTD